MGFSSFGFAAELNQPEIISGDRLRFISNAPIAWQESIQRAARLGEPHSLMRHAILQMPPVGWSADGKGNGHANGHAIVDDLSVNHVRGMASWPVLSGVVCPVSAPELEWGAMVFLSDGEKTPDELDGALPICSLYALNFCFWYMQIAQRRTPGRRALLSQREAECLSGAAQGLTSAEIGTLLAISARTVEGYISTACSKLNARGRQAAISRAYELNLLGGRNALRTEFERQRDEASRMPMPSFLSPP